MSATIVLAAGQSKRFGLADKLVQPAAGGAPLVVDSVRAVMRLTNGPVVLVVGRRPRPLIRALARHRLLGARLHICRNPHPARGMGYSLALGLAALPRYASRVNIHLADMAPVNRRLLYRLQQAARSPIDVARPVYAGCPGHPVRLSCDLLDPEALAAGQRAQELMATLPVCRRRLIRGTASCIRDADTRQMLRIMARWQPANRP